MTTTAVRDPLRVRLFGSNEYSWLWLAQVISGFGDWVGLFAITALTVKLIHQPAYKALATAGVLGVRVAPSLVLGPFMGVLIDRFDRKILMRIADISRAVIFCFLPWVTTVWGLVLVSLVLEVFTLLWSPAKESLVPLIVPRSRLTEANSLSVLAAYGTMPLAGVALSGLVWLDHRFANVGWLSPFAVGRHAAGTRPDVEFAYYFDALTFAITALIVWRCIKVSAKPARGGVAANATVERRNAGEAFRQLFSEMREGWKFIAANPVVRAVNVGLAAGLLGGAMIVPLGPTFADQVIGNANDFGLYITALGLGVAVGVATLNAVQKRIPKEKVFVSALFFAGGSAIFGVTMSTFWLSAIGVFGLGLGAGSVYVLGYTLLQENTEDELLGRTFTTLLALVRLGVLAALALAPLLSAGLTSLMLHWIGGRNGRNVPTVRWFDVQYGLPGVRVTLWMGGLMILVAAMLAGRSIDPSSGRFHLHRRPRTAS